MTDEYNSDSDVGQNLEDEPQELEVLDEGEVEVYDEGEQPYDEGEQPYDEGEQPYVDVSPEEDEDTGFINSVLSGAREKASGFKGTVKENVSDSTAYVKSVLGSDVDPDNYDIDQGRRNVIGAGAIAFTAAAGGASLGALEHESGGEAAANDATTITTEDKPAGATNETDSYENETTTENPTTTSEVQDFVYEKETPEEIPGPIKGKGIPVEDEELRKWDRKAYKELTEESTWQKVKNEEGPHQAYVKKSGRIAIVDVDDRASKDFGQEVADFESFSELYNEKRKE